MNVGILLQNKFDMAVLFIMVLLILRPLIYKMLRAKQYNNKAESNDRDKSAAEKTKSIFLIRPRSFSTDIVYKSIVKGDYIYFCRVGGQSYEIRDNEKDYNENMTDSLFLSDKLNFKLKISDIVSARINAKRSFWTGKNNGFLVLTTGNKKEKFIVHYAQNVEKVNDFFRNISNIPVELIKNENEEKQKVREESQTKRIEYKAAINIAIVMGILGLISGLWIWLYPQPYNVALIAGIALVIIILFSYIKFESFIKCDKGISPIIIVPAIAFPSIALCVRAICDFNVICKGLFWFYIGAITLIIFESVIINTKGYRARKWSLILILLIIFSYVYSSFAITNCIFDNSKPAKCIAFVKDKHVTASGNIKNYYLRVSLLGLSTVESGNIKVSKQMYESTKKDGFVKASIMNGRWGILWFKADESGIKK